jgi:N utilization substance protein B
MSKRRQAREYALQILYQIEQSGLELNDVIPLFWNDLDVEPEIREFAERLVKGVIERRDEIDKKIAAHSEHWKLGRMTRVDKSLLRLAVFEMFWCEDIPEKVTINEAVDLGKMYGTEDSGAFINGVLDSLLKEKGAERKKDEVGYN